MIVVVAEVQGRALTVGAARAYWLRSAHRVARRPSGALLSPLPSMLLNALKLTVSAFLSALEDLNTSASSGH